MLASEVISDIPFVDDITHDVVCAAIEKAYGQEYYDKRFRWVPARMFARDFRDAKHTELSWLEISIRMKRDEESHKQQKTKRFPLFLLMELFERGLYEYDDKEALEVLMPHFKTFTGKIHTDIFNPAHKDLYGLCFSYNLGCRYSFPILVNDSELRKFLFTFGNTSKVGEYNYDIVETFFSNFETSLPCKFTDYHCFTPEVIQAQVRYFRDLNLYWDHRQQHAKNMGSLYAMFCRWVYNTYEDNCITSNPAIISKDLLFLDKFTDMVISGTFDNDEWIIQKKMRGIGSGNYRSDKYKDKKLPSEQILLEYEATLWPNKQKRRLLLCKPLFYKSLRERLFKIKDYTGFDEATFFQQIEYFRAKYAYDQEKAKDSIEAIRRFYAYLIDKYPNHHFFEGSCRISKHLVKSRIFTDFVMEGYTFVTYGSLQLNNDITKLIVCFNSEYDMAERSQVDSAYFKINCTPIPNRLYRMLYVRYVFSLQFKGDTRILIEVLAFLFSIKSIPGSPSPDLRYLSAFDADQIRTLIFGKDLTDKGKGKLLNACKLFFEWAEDSEEMSVAPMAMIHFRSLPSHRQKPENESISKENIEKIAAYFLKQSERSFKFELCFVILNLMLQTPFRVKDICRLERDCLIQTGKNDVHIIRMKSKTSSGEYEDRTIPASTYRLIVQVLDRTKMYVEKCSVSSWKNSLFLLPNINSGGISPLSPNQFHSAMRQACKEIGLPNYTSANLRKAYMTFVYLESTRRDDGEYFLKTNSYHKTKRTTLTHYIDRNMVLMNLSFGYSLGSEEELKAIETAYVSERTKEAVSAERLTPDGIGYCDSKECIGMVTCLGCKHLVLTEDSEPAIRRIMTDLDRKIVECDIPHEKDSLIDIRAAYARCLNQINIHKQSRL